MKSIKKFWLWLTGKPYVVYVGRDKFECRVRKHGSVHGVDRQGLIWTDPSWRRDRCYVSLDEAENIRFDYRMVGELQT